MVSGLARVVELDAAYRSKANAKPPLGQADDSTRVDRGPIQLDA
tara:strand:- start:1137 stop:1268 length:132 start_codon:yes stop_codon:yes gene_type:complete